MADLPPTDTAASPPSPPTATLTTADPASAVPEVGGAATDVGGAPAIQHGMSTPAPSTAVPPPPDHAPAPSPAPSPETVPALNTLTREELSRFFHVQIDAMRYDLNEQFRRRLQDVGAAHDRQLAMLTLQHQGHLANVASPVQPAVQPPPGPAPGLPAPPGPAPGFSAPPGLPPAAPATGLPFGVIPSCLLYTSDAADE